MLEELFQIKPNSLDTFAFWVNVYALIISIVGIILSTKKLDRFWQTRHLRKIWGIKNGDYVTVVCSELDEPEQRQNVEPREFIYSLKYGDIDAFFEVIITLLRLFPKIKLRILSSGEAKNTRIDFSQHLILIGGPDYNAITRRVLAKGITRFNYKSPFLKDKSEQYPDEMVVYDQLSDVEYCELDDEHDFGYFERINNPNNPDFSTILIGGSHTIGITSAVKAFSMADSERGEIPDIVLKNAKVVSKCITGKSDFSVLVSAERIGQTISVPVVKDSNVKSKKDH